MAFSYRHALFLVLSCTFLLLLYYFHTEKKFFKLNEELRHSSHKRPSSLVANKGQEQDKTIVIYNRIPKTASTSFMHIQYKLCTANNYHVVLVELSKPQHYFSFQDTIHFARNISSWSDRLPAIYHGHFAYADFSKLGDLNPNPIYINMMRDPMERFVSYYYFLRYGDDFRADKIRSRMGDETTFDECVQKRRGDCSTKKLWMQIPWFCGSHAKCWEPGNRWALDQAKHNLVNQYFLVGITEDLQSFVEILELTLPRFFKGAGEFFETSGESLRIRKTKKKIEPSEETIRILEESKVWKMEKEFYDFARDEFNKIKSEVLENDVTETRYQYLKVRPR